MFFVVRSYAVEFAPVNHARKQVARDAAEIGWGHLLTRVVHQLRNSQWFKNFPMGQALSVGVNAASTCVAARATDFSVRASLEMTQHADIRNPTNPTMLSMLSFPYFWPRRTFAGLEAELAAFESARFVVLPAPYDSTTTWRVGTRTGPAAIIDASMNMETFEREFGREVCEVGIHTTPDIEPDMSGPGAMATRIESVVGEVLDAEKIPVLLGGEHGLTLGGVRALAARHPKISILQIDAHPDLRQSYEETPYSHGSVMRRCSEFQTSPKSFKSACAPFRAKSGRTCPLTSGSFGPTIFSMIFHRTCPRLSANSKARFI